MNHRGVVYLLEGTRHATRLIVSLWTLRKHYLGPVTLFTTDREADAMAQHIVDDRRIKTDAVRIRPAIADGKNRSNVIKTCLFQYSPYESTVFLDCDTLVQDDISDLFDIGSQGAVVVTRFATWTTFKRAVRRRLRSWLDTHPDLVRFLAEEMPAVNTGVLAFTRSTAILLEWHLVTLVGRHHFIPDEIAMQLLINRYSFKLMDSRFNFSVKYDPGDMRKAAILHFHGRSHRGVKGDTWRRAFSEVLTRDVAGVAGWLPPDEESLRVQLGLNA